MDNRRMTIAGLVTLALVMLTYMYLESARWRPKVNLQLISRLTTNPETNVVNKSVHPKMRDYLTEEEVTGDTPLTDVMKTVSLKTSQLNLVENRTMYKVGEDIKLHVTLRDGYNTSRKQGGDQLRVRIYNSTLNASASGKVIDHNNGSYTIVLRALWPGRQTISVILAYRRETVRSIYYIRKKLPATRNILAVFESRDMKEKTLCHPDVMWLGEHQDVCNFTATTGGVPWYCRKPVNRVLLCEDWTGVGLQVPYPELPLSPVEKQLLGAKWDVFPAVLVDVTGTRTSNHNLTPCYLYPKQNLWRSDVSTGYFYNNTWLLHHCSRPSTTDIQSCMRDTRLMLCGDSTTRQWYKFLLNIMSCQQVTGKWMKEKWHKRSICTVPSLNFTMEWLPHAQPFCVGGFDTNKYTLNSMLRHLNEINDDGKYVFVIHSFMHIVPYHHSVFRERMRRLSNAVKDFLQRNKRAKVLIKGPHTYFNTPAASQRLSDYFGYLYRDIMYEEFLGLHDKVIYMDQKDMTIAKALTWNHPPVEVVREAIYQMFSYICQ